MPKSRVIEYNGESKSLTAWATEYGMPMRLLWNRVVARGWDMDRALSEPFDSHGPKSRPIEQRLIERLTYEPNSGCWLWTGNVNHKGYGQIGIGSDGMRSTHRVAYEAWRGEIHDGMSVLHACDMPPCCNPSHLFLGTHQDNMTDRWLKGRYRKSEKKSIVIENSI